MGEIERYLQQALKEAYPHKTMNEMESDIDWANQQNQWNADEERGTMEEIIRSGTKKRMGAENNAKQDKKQTGALNHREIIPKRAKQGPSNQISEMETHHVPTTHQPANTITRHMGNVQNPDKTRNKHKTR